MFDIIQSANRLFHSTVNSYKEILFEFTCTYIIEKKNLPQKEELETFLAEKPSQDKIEVIITNDEEILYITESFNWADEYDRFIQNTYEDDKVTVDIKVSKVVREGKLSVYNLDKFSDFLCGSKFINVFVIFTQLFREGNDHIEFQLLEASGLFLTNSIVFSDKSIRWDGTEPRKNQLKNCNDASVFLDREKIRLVPQDFEMQGIIEGRGFDRIAALFKKLRSILAYIYLANTSTIVNDIAILQFDPTERGYEYGMECIAQNTIVSEIYDWIFQGDAFIDKASIARKVIILYCKNQKDILSIDEKILNSIKSNYVIYQKNYVDQYIDMKNRISDYIVESADKIQSLSYNITDAFRNNFVAVIVFLMTVLLTDSIDFTQLSGRELSPRFAWICGIFTVATFLYFVATIYMGKQKWNWLKQSYDDLKNNYIDVFDKKDIEDAFRKDEALTNAEKQYKGICWKIGTCWVVIILVMAIFTGSLWCQGRNTGDQQIQTNENVVDTEDLTSSNNN